MKVRIAPSLLAADFARLSDEIATVEEAGADLLHLDVMDAHFVPNLTFGPLVIAAVRRLTRLPLDVHLMVTDPDRFLDDYLEAGADRIDFHLEPFAETERTRRAEQILERLERAGVERGIAVSPATPIEIVLPWLERLDAVLVMTVEPGFGGQALIPECAAKVPALRARSGKDGQGIEIGVDGGVNTENAAALVASGVGMLVAGSAVFRAPDPAKAVARLRQAV